MPTHSDLLADLPAPRDDEPSSLRQDILDELSDHLACAMHRELVKTGDEQVATARVLDRFGDPRRVAVQLWFQAMWSRIMLQRVSMGLQGLLVAGVLATAFLMFRVLDFQARIYDDWQAIKNHSASNQAMLLQLLQRLPQPAPSFYGAASGEGGMGMASDMSAGYGAMGGEMVAPGMSGAPGMGAAIGTAPAPTPKLIIHVADPTHESQPANGYFLEVQDENGKGIPGDAVGTSDYGGMGMGMGGGGFESMSGMPTGNVSGVTFTGDGRYIRMWIDQPGPKGIGYTNVPLGRYTALIEFPDGRTGKQRFAVLPKEAKAITIQCPPPVEPSLVTIAGPKLENIGPNQEILAHVDVSRPSQRLGNTEWLVTDCPQWHVTLDLATGLVKWLSSPERKEIRFDESDPVDVRFISLKSGSYDVRWTTLINNQKGVNGSLEQTKLTDQATYVAEPGTSTWTLPLPESIQKQLQERAQQQVRPNTLSRGFVETSSSEDGTPSGHAQLHALGPMGVIAINPDPYGSAALAVSTPGGRFNLTLGTTHRLMLLQVPGITRPLVVRTEMELPSLTSEAIDYVSKNAIPLQLTTEDINSLNTGNPLTKVFSLGKATVEGDATTDTIKTTVSTRLDAGVDPVEEAKTSGTVLAIWRLEPPSKLPSRETIAPESDEK